MNSLQIGIHSAAGGNQAIDLAAIIRAYSEVTDRLRKSHDLLVGEVCRLREQLAEKNRQLERSERLAALGEMAAGVAHEIRNPLGGISLYAGLLEKDLEPLPAEQELARKIRAGVHNLETIVSDILAFARGSEPNIQPTGLDEVLVDVLEQVQPQARVKHVAISVSAELKRCRLLCDRRQIERALVNLVFNAIDAVAERGHVTLGSRPCTQDGAALIGIVVADDGPGIPPEHMQRIFNPFFTSKDTGTGLGLAIVHRIAEAHGGFISATNGDSGGAEFTLAIRDAAVPAVRGNPGGRAREENDSASGLVG